jgi:8-oxo-dGTP pyrophosphatase MutT (NUDIX family)
MTYSNSFTFCGGTLD